jgi:glycerol-3-phosphate cytidylyltransferase-like family protein
MNMKYYSHPSVVSIVVAYGILSLVALSWLKQRHFEWAGMVILISYFWSSFKGSPQNESNEMIQETIMFWKTTCPKLFIACVWLSIIMTTNPPSELTVPITLLIITEILLTAYRIDYFYKFDAALRVTEAAQMKHALEMLGAYFMCNGSYGYTSAVVIWLALIFALKSIYEKTIRLVVFVNLSSRIMKYEHVRFLKKASRLGTHLVVGIVSDNQLPKVTEPGSSPQQLKEYLQELPFVTEVVEDTPLVISKEFMRKYNITYIVHQENISQEDAKLYYPYALQTGACKVLP